MGLFDHLFKPKPSAAAEKGGEASPKPADAAEKPAPSGAAAADPSAFLHPKGYGTGSDDPFVPVPPSSGRSLEKKPDAKAAQDESAGEVVLALGDILARIPTHFLRAGMHDLKRELRFNINALSPDIARGRASVRLSVIAALCPEIFHSAIGPLEDVDVRLPLQKLVEQIGRIRGDAHPRWQAPETPLAPAAGIPVSPGAPANAEVPAPGPAAPAEELQIYLSVAALVPGIPREIIIGPLPHVDERVRIALPFAPVERQLSSGAVEVSSKRFVSVLPPELRRYFAAREGVKVPLPLEEIFQNLPNAGVKPAPAPARQQDEAPESSPPPAAVEPPAVTVADATPDESLPAQPLPRTPAPPPAPPLSTTSAVSPPPTDSSPAPYPTDAPQAGFVPPVRLPPVRLFAPPPPLFGGSKTPQPDAVPAAPVAPPPAPALLAEPVAPPVQPQIPAATAAVNIPPPPPPAPVPVPATQPLASAESAVDASGAPVMPAPILLKPAAPAEAPAPSPGAANPEPAPAVMVRPPILQPPMLFGQRMPATAPATPEGAVPPQEPPSAPAQPAAAPEAAPDFSLPVPRPDPRPAPAPIPDAAPPALPLSRFDQDSLQALFMTEEVLDLQKISRLAASLPGVQACVIATRETAVTGGQLPEGFDVTALLGLAPRVGEAAGRLPIGGLKHFTLYGEHYSVSFFERSGLCLCAVHRPRSFVPGVREKLVALADELAG